MSEVDVSVVVCTYNRADLLRNALASLVALRTSGRFQYEVVVVDNASTDHTSRVIAETAQTASVPVRGVCESRRGISCARNRGIAEARGEWIAFFDDDQEADADWLRRLLEMAEGKNASCVGGAVRLLLPDPVLQDLPEVCRESLGESVGMDAPCRYSHRSAPGTGNLLVHRKVFSEIGNFNETLREAGEDSDLYRRMRAAEIDAWYTPLAIVRHVTPSYRLEESYLRWRFLRFGCGLARRDRQEWGRAGFLAVLAARFGQITFRYLPQLCWARLARSRKQQLEARCRLWRAEGYARLALAWLAPRLLAQEDFFASLDFRGERQTAWSVSPRPPRCPTDHEPLTS